jgi:hypothetical protein
MGRRKSFPVKKAFLGFILAIFGAGASFIIFLSSLSIMVGFMNMNQDGFFIPILAGGFSIAVCLILFLWVMKITFRITKEKDLFTTR